eukprot:1503706-Prymnesium_polylepis.1
MKTTSTYRSPPLMRPPEWRSADGCISTQPCGGAIARPRGSTHVPPSLYSSRPLSEMIAETSEASRWIGWCVSPAAASYCTTRARYTNNCSGRATASGNARAASGYSVERSARLSRRRVSGSACTLASRFVSIIVKELCAPAAMWAAASRRIAAHDAAEKTGCSLV